MTHPSRPCWPHPALLHSHTSSPVSPFSFVSPTPSSHYFLSERWDSSAFVPLFCGAREAGGAEGTFLLLAAQVRSRLDPDYRWTSSLGVLTLSGLNLRAESSEMCVLLLFLGFQFSSSHHSSSFWLRFFPADGPFTEFKWAWIPG